MKIIWGMASGCGHLIKSRKWSSKIKRIVATANEESNSMHDEVVKWKPSRWRILYKTLK
jgi:hypothetical protein